jgi:putative transposase
LSKLWVDQGFRGSFVDWVAQDLKIEVEVTQGIGKPGSPGRWVIERTLAWLTGFRRLTPDFEYLACTTEAIIYACMIRLRLARFAKIA